MDQLNDESKKTMVSILYIITYRECNHYRRKNLSYIYDWIKFVKTKLENTKQIIFDILVVDQNISENNKITNNYEDKYLFLYNKSVFNKGWSFNCAVNKYPNYTYYAFADADMLIPDIESFCKEIIEHCYENPKKSFRPFNSRFDTTLLDMQKHNNLNDIILSFDAKTIHLTEHKGLSLASNIIFICNEIYNEVGGWDEQFRGWGRYDDFLGYKLIRISECETILSPLKAIHLWHPITLDFSLKQETINLYDKFIKYTHEQLVELIKTNIKTNSNPNKYK